MDNIRIKEDSWVAKLAAIKLGTSNVAIVLGSTIHLHNTSKQDFLGNRNWVKHELCHIGQFKKHGFLLFILKYSLESIRHGYHNNKYEIEARACENL